MGDERLPDWESFWRGSSPGPLSTKARFRVSRKEDTKDFRSLFAGCTVAWLHGHRMACQTCLILEGGCYGPIPSQYAGTRRELWESRDAIC